MKTVSEDQECNEESLHLLVIMEVVRVAVLAMLLRGYWLLTTESA